MSDPAKSADPKYRQLKLSSEKVRTKLLSCAAAVPLLQALGFVEVDGEGDGDGSAPFLRYASDVVDHAAMSHMMNEIASTLTQLDQSNIQNKKPKLDANNVNSSTTSSSTIKKAHSMPHSKLTEKQKARRLLEEKERQERETAKAVRKANVALLKQDKYVRENDDNWTSGVSAACAKSGDSISTFRDKYGE